MVWRDREINLSRIVDSPEFHAILLDCLCTSRTRSRRRHYTKGKSCSLLGSPYHLSSYSKRPDTSDSPEKVQIPSIVAVATTDGIYVCEESGRSWSSLRHRLWQFVGIPEKRSSSFTTLGSRDVTSPTFGKHGRRILRSCRTNSSQDGLHRRRVATSCESAENSVMLDRDFAIKCLFGSFDRAAT